MSDKETNENNTRKIAYVRLTMPDGKNYEIPLPAKVFSSGREGFYSQVPSFVYQNEVYGGQIQIWKKGEGYKK